MVYSPTVPPLKFSQLKGPYHHAEKTKLLGLAAAVHNVLQASPSQFPLCSSNNLLVPSWKLKLAAGLEPVAGIAFARTVYKTHSVQILLSREGGEGSARS